jgi:hypothetical protein
MGRNASTSLAHRYLLPELKHDPFLHRLRGRDRVARLQDRPRPW